MRKPNSNNVPRITQNNHNTYVKKGNYNVNINHYRQKYRQYKNQVKQLEKYPKTYHPNRLKELKRDIKFKNCHYLKLKSQNPFFLKKVVLLSR